MKYPAPLGQGWVLTSHWFTKHTGMIFRACYFNKNSALIKANGSVACAYTLCRDKTWQWLGYKHLVILNWLNIPTKYRHAHSSLSCPENQGIRKQKSFSIMVDNGWKGKIYMMWHSFIWNYSLRSTWTLLNGATACYNKILKFVYPFTYWRGSLFNYWSVTLGICRIGKNFPIF